MLNVSNSITPNLYAYCDNDPVNKVDPTGYLGLEAMLIISIGAGLAIGAWKLSRQMKKKEYKQASDASKFYMGIVSFFMGFLQGFTMTFLAFLTNRIITAIILGVIYLFVSLIKAFYSVFVKGGTIKEGAATDAFIEGFSSRVLDATDVIKISLLINLLSSKNHKDFIKVLCDECLQYVAGRHFLKCIS